MTSLQLAARHASESKMSSPQPHPTFKSARLVYRAVEKNDQDKAFIHGLMNDPVIAAATHLSIHKPETMEAAEVLLKDLQNSILGVIICLPTDPAASADSSAGEKPKAEPVAIGYLYIGLGELDSSGHYYWHQHRDCELGITLAPAYQGKGYGREVVDWALDWAFRRANMHSVTLACYGYNKNAQRLYEKAGFKLDGRLRERIWFDRKWHDMLEYSMLESEWEALRGLR